MSITYNVLIKPAEDKNKFQVTWQKVDTHTQDWFTQAATITPEEAKILWQEPEKRIAIGEKLFRFLDGDSRHLARALKEASQQGEALHLYLHTCPQTADWPFELLADHGEFLLLQKLHLVRCVSDWGSGRLEKPQNRPLTFLFMASSALHVIPELDYEGEEDAIFRSTENLAIHMEVEDSGSLQGLARQLEMMSYDVIQLSGHAEIDPNAGPFFIMENEWGERQDVFPAELWNEALIENAPRLLFLSGCHTGQNPTRIDNGEAVSFAHSLVAHFNVPTVLGWGRNVNDAQAIHAEKMLFHELSRGKSILEAVQRARYELQNHVSPEEENDWPLLRLFSNGVALTPMVTKGQPVKPIARRMTYTYLKSSRVKVLTEGFIGQRRQRQLILNTLKQNDDKVGVLILGTAGLGKSCLAGKICERLSDFYPICVSGPLNAFTLEAALKDTFIISKDKKGTAILSQHLDIKDKLTQLCADSFKEQRYLILLDDFDKNIAGAEAGLPGPLNPEAAELLSVLLHYLPISGKMTQLIITSRYGFSLTQQNQDMVAKQLQPVYLTSFQESQQSKKLAQLQNLLNYNQGVKMLDLMRAGKGNPFLMELIDTRVGGLLSAEYSQVEQAIKEEREKFIQKNLLRPLFQQNNNGLDQLLRLLCAFSSPVQKQEIQNKAAQAGLENWQDLLTEGIRLSLIEHNQAQHTYQLTPLLPEELHLVS